MVASVLDFLRSNSEKAPNEIAFTFTDMSPSLNSEIQLTWLELSTAVDAFSQVLSNTIAQGERAIVAVKPNLGFVIAMLACIRAQVVAVPIYPPSNERYKRIAKHIISDCGATFAISDLDIDPAELGLKKIQNVSDKYFSQIIQKYRASSYVPIESHALAYLQYTSGSTSDPKGVRITHKNILANTKALGDFCKFKDGDRILSWLPLYHDMGLVGGVFQPLVSKIPVWLSSPYHFARSPKNWLKFISDKSITHSGGPNSAFVTLLQKTVSDNSLNQFGDLSRLRIMFNGSERVDPIICKQFEDRFSNSGLTKGTITPCYGLAENTLFVAASSFHQKKNDQHVSCGKPGLGIGVLTVDSKTGQIINDDRRVGELLICGDSVADGYWGRHVDANSNFTEINGVRAVKTGDLGFFQDDCIYVCGRSKDVIILGGRNIFPTDIEQLINNNPQSILSKCSAVCVEAPLGRISVLIEIPKAKIENLDFMELKHTVAKLVYLGTGQHPDQVFFAKRGGIPRAANGKIQRYVCEAALRSRQYSKLGVTDITGKKLERTKPIANYELGKEASELIYWLNRYADRRLSSLQMRERRTIPANVILDFGRKGIFGLQVPKRLGGLGLSLNDTLRVQTAVANLDTTLATFIGVHNALALAPILKFGTQQQKDMIVREMACGRAIGAFALTEENSGSYPVEIKCSATVVRNGYLLNGQKRWVGNAAWAKYIVVVGKVASSSGPRFSTFIVDTEQDGVAMGQEALTMGVKAMIQNDLHFQNVFIPNDMVLGNVGDGYKIAHETMRFGRLGISAIAIGAMQQALSLASNFARNRKIAGQRLIDLPYSRSVLFDIGVTIEFLKAATEKMALKADCGTVSEEALSAIKIVSAEVAWNVVDQSMQILGARGYMENNLLPQLVT
ncbi:MAG: AMP-binding protein, partial [Pseudomonadota bacterium]